MNILNNTSKFNYLSGNIFDCQQFLNNFEGYNKKEKFMSKETLVVGSKVKDFIKDNDLRSDGDLIDALSERVSEMLKSAMVRCKENGRSTVRPCDL